MIFFSYHKNKIKIVKFYDNNPVPLFDSQKHLVLSKLLGQGPTVFCF